MRSRIPAQDAQVGVCRDVPVGDASSVDHHDARHVAPTSHAVSQTIDWYAPGQSKSVEIAGVEVTVRFVGRKGRRARIAITAPAGATFRDGQESVARLANGVAKHDP